MSFEIIAENLDLYLEGLWTTTWLVTSALLIGLIMAVPLSVGRTAKQPWIWGPIWAFTYFFRGTPLLVQLFLIYYGSGQFEAVRTSFLWPILREAWACALIAFSLNTAAYTTEIFAGAIRSTNRGEIEAAIACGMSPLVRLRRIILPSALRRALPAYGNEVIFMLHGSAVASVVTIVDLTGAARIVNSRFYSPYEAFLTAAAFYLVLTFLIVFAFRQWEKRWHAHLKER